MSRLPTMAPGMDSCAPAKRQTRTTRTARRVPTLGRAGRVCWRRANSASMSSEYWMRLTMRLLAPSSDSSDDPAAFTWKLVSLHLCGWLGGKNLCRHLGLGLRNLETGFLSSEARFREISRPLLVAAEHRGGELHLPSFSYGEAIAGMDGGNSGRFRSGGRRGSLE